MTTTKKIELWKAEFGKNYNVPQAIAAAEGIEDTSWHNDICPSFEWASLKGRDYDAMLRLWVEHPDPEQRETGPASPRFMITLGTETELFAGDDAAEAIRRFIEERDKLVAERCLPCDNGRQMPEAADLRIEQDGHSATVYCRHCGRCLQA